MSEFDVLIVNVYLLSIFTNLIKTKTTIHLYRFFKLLVVVLFAFVIIQLIMYPELFTFISVLKNNPVIPFISRCNTNRSADFLKEKLD